VVPCFLWIDYYEVNEPLTKFLLQRTLENLVFEMSHLVGKYSKAIVNLVVKDQTVINNGTAFFGMKNLVLTNKHVIDEDAGDLSIVFSRTGAVCWEILPLLQKIWERYCLQNPSMRGLSSRLESRTA
jgi:hypothetical protein